MSWTYSGDPSTSDLDQVRFLSGDTDIEDQLISDEEINFTLILGGGNTSLAAAFACEGMASRCMRVTDETVGPLSRSASQRTAAFLERAKRLRELSQGSLALPFFGGLTNSGKLELNSDTDAVQPSFSRGMDDYPGTRDSDLGDFFSNG